jgi:hypothetical protein
LSIVLILSIKNIIKLFWGDFWIFTIIKNYQKFQQKLSLSIKKIVIELSSLGQLAFIDAVNEIYDNHPNDLAVGYYSNMSPWLVIKDLELAKRILIKDFDHFMDRRHFDLNPKANKYFDHMFFKLKGETMGSKESWSAVGQVGQGRAGLSIVE